jgi:hypothetical protein
MRKRGYSIKYLDYLNFHSKEIQEERLPAT